MQIIRYNNYHKHDHESNIWTLDCVVKPIDYMKRAVELGHNTYFTTQHGWTGKYLKAYDLCQEYGLKMIYSAELYCVKDRTEKDNSNFHIIVVGKNQDSFYELNRIISKSNIDGFYYKPRVDIELLTSLNPNNFYITSACVGGILRNDESISTFLEPLYKHFGNNFLLEVQNHNQDVQKKHNKKILELNKKYGIKLIHANDSHYIYPEQAEDRRIFLKGKNMNYGDEDTFILDYPDFDTIIKRYKDQNVLSDKQIEECLLNTLIFDNCEELYFDKEIKMVDIYPGVNKEKKIKEILAKKWKEEKKKINPEKIEDYKNGINFEYKIIRDTNMIDYFLFNERMVDLAVNKYGGILSRTGRGSAVSFYVNKLFGFTEIDRFESEVPLYPTRFMSVARILQTKSLPDIDMNWADVTAPIKASKELLGDDCVYYMYALGTMQESSAFRNLCRAYDMEVSEYNEVAKDLDKYRNNPMWKNLIQESQKYIGTIENISPSPCSFLLSNKPLSTELGLIKVGDEICVCIDGDTADAWKYLKNDYLTVRVWKIISDTYKLLNKPIPDIRELKTLLDDKVWDLYANGLTATLNQADTDISTQMLKKYKPRTVGELSAFVAAIRPGFASLLNIFLNRETYSTGVAEVDKLLEPSYHFMLYQESIMAFLVWCGMEEDHTYDIIKKISKKKFTDEEKYKLKEELKQGFVKNIGNDNGFEEIWQVVDDASRYSFNAAHALSVCWDSLYGAELKAHYPLEYFTVVLNEYKDDTEKTKRITQELPHFNIKLLPIKFGKSLSDYTFDRETNSIYKGIGSVKYCNDIIANELMELSYNKYDNFVDLLADIKAKTSVNSRQIRILILLNFFSEFGKNKYLLDIVDIYDKFYSVKQINKNKLESLGIPEELIKKYSRKETQALYKEIDNDGLIKELTTSLVNKSLSVIEQIKGELEYLEYTTYVNPNVSEKFYIVTEFKTYKDLTKPYVTLRNIKTGEEIKTKIKQGQIFVETPFSLYNMLKVDEFKEQYKTENVGGKWIKTDKKEKILYKYVVVA